MNPQKGTLTPKHRLGRPRQSTLHDGRQLLYGVSAMAEQSPQLPHREEWQQPTKVPLSRWLINNRLVQAEHYERCPWRKPLSAGS